jgi:hypothetical protein
LGDLLALSSRREAFYESIHDFLDTFSDVTMISDKLVPLFPEHRTPNDHFSRPIFFLYKKE